MAETTAETISRMEAERSSASAWARPFPVSAIYSVAAVAVILIFSLGRGHDYVGPDNDDVMRLVQVRDLLAGQGWFDPTQYRLGLAGGTLMHWSRLVDLPLALLIGFFALFLAPTSAEAAALAVWPLSLVPLLLWPLALAAHGTGGRTAVHIACGLAAILVLGSGRFVPGAIDHHNVQLVLTAWMLAMLLAPDRAVLAHAIGGIACALAIAVGAETVPLVATACACVAVRWAWHGAPAAGAARHFSLALAITVSAVFVLTIPPRSYSVVTCDSLSFGFYALSVLGGSGLFLVASLAGRLSRRARIGCLTALAGALLLAARTIAPDCLGNPLSGLDPMLVDLWLSHVTEAQSFLALARTEPEMVGRFYAGGLLGLLVCASRVLRDDRKEMHLVLLALLATACGISLLQVRGAVFADLIAILPLTLLIADLRRRVMSDTGNVAATAAYVSLVLASVPMVWGLAGIIWKEDWKVVARDVFSAPAAAVEGECNVPAGLAALSAAAPGVVAAPSNSGAEILRFTSHRVLAAPYHRNQGGMLTELHIGLAPPEEAQAFLKGAGVTLVAFCPTDPQTRALITAKPDGLYAGLARGEVPAYLRRIGHDAGVGFQIFKVVPNAD